MQLFIHMKYKVLDFLGSLNQGLIVTHPLRIFFFFILLSPILIPIALGGLFGLLVCIFAPAAVIKAAGSLEWNHFPNLIKMLMIWIFGVLICGTSFIMGTAGILVYLSDMYWTVYLSICGKIKRGRIVSFWNTSSRAGNSTTHSAHCTVSFVSDDSRQEIRLSGASQRSFLQEILEIEIEKERDV
ncbi:MAG TPA: hypothetical protein PKK05_28275, partial [Leptospiraceae bacterium]|nr:hypothetical protein [Leptospiraceae bacterium]